jgi:hypothetical protein
VPRAKLACDRVGGDGDGMAVQLSRPALRLLSGPTACVDCQLVWLHGEENRSPTRRGGRVRIPGTRCVPWPTPQPESRGARAGRRLRAESCARRRLLVRGRDLSCEAETCRARRRFVGGGPSWRELVVDAPNWSGTGCLASEGLDRGPGSSSS